MSAPSPPQTIDDYIHQQTAPIQEILQKARHCIREAAPEATETIKYGIPTLVQNGNLVHFGAFESHLGFYPTPSAITHFAKQFAPYKSAKGSVQFPYDQPIPWDLIQEVTRYRVAENLNRTPPRKKK